MDHVENDRKEGERVNMSTTENSRITGVSNPHASKVGEIEEDNGAMTITIANKKFSLGKSAEEDKELMELKHLIQTETTHGQWKKQAIVWFMIACVILMNLMLGSSKFKSIAGIQKCSVWYWLVQLVFVMICVVVTWLSIKLNRKEQNLKIKY